MDIQANAVRLADRTRLLAGKNASAANRVIAAGKRGWIYAMSHIHFTDRYEALALDCANASQQAAAQLQLIVEERSHGRRLLA